MSTIHRKHDTRRSGMALILVLGMIAITLGLCYSMLRLQATSLQVANNASRQSDARQAARAGLSFAMQQMHQSSWGGIDSTITENVDANTYFHVTYATGDAELVSSDADYKWYPYRVTITSTGFAADPLNPSFQSQYQVSAVMQLVPRALGADPSNWSELNSYTVYQWADDTVEVNLPVQVEGPVMLQGPVSMAPDYPHDEKPFHGTIDNVSIITDDLSAAEVAALAAAGLLSSDAYSLLEDSHSPSNKWQLNESAGATIAVDSAGSQDGTYVGATSGGSGAGFATGNLGASFDGQNDHIDVGSFGFSGHKLTILAWFKADSFGSDGRIISKAVSDEEDDHYFMVSTFETGGDVRLRFRIRGGGTTSTLIASSGNLVTNSWVFVAAVYDGTDMKLYKNGVLVGSMSKSGNLANNGSVPVFIGDNPPGSTRGKYLRDLATLAGGGDDYRPFTGDVSLPRSNNGASALSLLEDDLNLSITNVATDNSSPLSWPSGNGTYKLYPGGKSYTVSGISTAAATDATLAPDMSSNPLGLRLHLGRLNVGDNLNFEGTIFSFGYGADVHIDGDNVVMQPAWMPSLYGDSDTPQMPVAVTADDFRVRSGAEATINGMAVVWDEFDISSGTDDTVCDFQGRVICGELLLQERDEWAQSASWYRDQLWSFRGQDAITTYPAWLESAADLVVAPKSKIRPQANIRYIWQDWYEAVYQPHADDPGLRWNVIRWIESP